MTDREILSELTDILRGASTDRSEAFHAGYMRGRLVSLLDRLNAQVKGSAETKALPLAGDRSPLTIGMGDRVRVPLDPQRARILEDSGFPARAWDFIDMTFFEFMHVFGPHVFVIPPPLPSRLKIVARHPDTPQNPQA